MLAVTSTAIAVNIASVPACRGFSLLRESAVRAV